MSKKDVFPSTMCTWINGELDAGETGRLEVNEYIMRTYAWPLQVYFRGTNSRWLGEAEDVVAGFFADRLGRRDWLQKWQASGIRLRRWLMNGFCFYLKEQRRAWRVREASPDSGSEPLTFSGDPKIEVDKAAVIVFVQQAMEATAVACRAEGLETHWSVFLRHQVDGVSLIDLAEEIGENSARVAVMARTARRKFRGALEEVLIADGVPRDQVDQEIRSLLEVTG